MKVKEKNRKSINKSHENTVNFVIAKLSRLKNREKFQVHLGELIGFIDWRQTIVKLRRYEAS